MGEIVTLARAFPGRPAFDTAVSHALLRRMADARAPETLRLYQPDDVLAFSVLDRTRPGFARAVAAARARGFCPVLRLAGGRAAVFHRATLAFAWSRPVADLRGGIEERFRETSEIVVAALRSLGVDARAGAVPGEYCPGAHSVNARGAVKLAGIGQRVVRGAAHLGGVIVVGGSARVREALVPVYRELGFELDPARAGSLEDELGPLSPDAVAEALRAELARRYALRPGEPDAATLVLAEALAPEHALGASPVTGSPPP